LPPASAAYLTDRSFFPHLISGPFIHGLHIAFGFSVIMCLIAAAASWLRGGRFVYPSSVPVETGLATPAQAAKEKALATNALRQGVRDEAISGSR
jgi:hypothetical protein